jgi:2-dehydro-3-deoxyphosphogalactonate aldolase
VSNCEAFSVALKQCPLVAILRGVRPSEVDAIGDVLVEAGITLIEVPLNSPDPFDSIARLCKRIGDHAMIGAGTVLNVADVQRLRDVGGRMVISPNTNPLVIQATVAAGMASLPGYFSPSEAFVAIAAGATALKLFPAEAASPRVLKAQRAVIPNGTPILPVGGISPETMQAWLAAGADGFGLGSALYSAGAAPGEVASAARNFVQELTTARS